MSLKISGYYKKIKREKNKREKRANNLLSEMNLDYLSKAEIKIEIEKMKLLFLKKDLTNIEKMLENNFLKSYQINSLVAEKWKIIGKINLIIRDLIFYLLLCRVFVYNENIKLF